MKILITGANGMVAHATALHCTSLGDEVVPLSRTKLDIAHQEAVDHTLASFRPDVVINCAAYTNVDGAESERDAAFSANVTGVKNLAEATKKINACFVTISTDYVFDGSFPGFYTQDHMPNPLGVYARTKLEGEVAAREANPDSVIVRSGWIYGANGTNFLSVIQSLLRESKPVKAINDSFGTPTFAGDLAVRLRELAGLRHAGLFHVTNSGPGTSYAGFADTLCKIGRFDPALIESISKDEIKRPAQRPASSKLKCLLSEKLGLAPMPDWEDAQRRFLRDLEDLV